MSLRVVKIDKPAYISKDFFKEEIVLELCQEKVPY